MIRKLSKFNNLSNGCMPNRISIYLYFRYPKINSNKWIYCSKSKKTFILRNYFYHCNFSLNTNLIYFKYEKEDEI